MIPDLARDDVFRLETRRLWLRWPRAQDAAAIARLARDPAVAAKTLDLPHPYPEGAAAEFTLTARKANSDGERLVLALTHKARPDQTIGCLTLRPTASDQADVCFWLGIGHWGRGLMTEAVRGLVDFVFGLTHAVEIGADAPFLNPQALRVLANCGFLPGGSGRVLSPARGGHVPVERFRLDRDHWSREHGRRAADAQNAMSVLRASAGR